MAKDKGQSVDTPEKIEAIKSETVFLVIKDKDGSFKVITDISQKIELSRPATMQDIKQGCLEIVKSIEIRQTAETTASMIVSMIKNLEK